MQSKKFKTEVGGRELSVEIGKFAQQTNASAVVRYGDTVVLTTAVMSDKPRSTVNYLPLTIEYEERLYAAGKIKGSRFIKREGRASDNAILSGRIIDRTIRPLFNSRIRNDIQIVATVLSYDRENDPVFVGLVGASIALAISNIPWNGPVGGVFIGRIDDKWIINPKNGEIDKSVLNFMVAGTKDRVNMIEGGAAQVDEALAIEAIEEAKKEIKKLVEFQEEIIKDFSPKKNNIELFNFNAELVKDVSGFVDDKLENAIYVHKKQERISGLDKLEEELEKFITEKYANDEKIVEEAKNILEEKINAVVHKNILGKEKRPDGRKLDELREINCEIGLLPRTHGSGLFTRGETQALSVVTLGPPGDEQIYDEMELEGTKRFMHHYNFPPFSVGETGPMRGPGRREIGHGALAEKALFPLIPSKEEFPYTIRIVSEILSSNGSSSMASVCGSILALMDAGVPIKEKAAGISMGLMSGDGKYKILTDIQGPEDHYGDMDLKIAGTRKGIAVMQMDVKVEGLEVKILKDAFAQAKKAREEILDKMEAVIKTPRPDLSPYAPRVYTLHIKPDQIGSVIGPGGKMINKIIDETGATIDIDDDGTVFVASEKAEGAEKAIAWIKSLTRELKTGEIFQGKVVKITDFGAFIELLPGQDGLLHISELAPHGKKIKSVEDLIHRGDIITVRIKNIDESGKISLALFKKGMQM